MKMLDLVLAQLSDFMWGYPMILLLIGTHLFFTFRLRFPQRYILKGIKLSVTSDKESKGDISPFGSLATSLAATLGTGNIIGVATAVALGGPGAVLWCWLTGVLGISTKYAEGVLAVKYRAFNTRGEMIGGPMFALERGVGAKWLGVIFAIFTAIAAFGIGNTIQSNSIAAIATTGFGIPSYITGSILSVLTGLVILFGIRKIATVCSALVPFMAIVYILGCLLILFINRSFLGETISLITSSAFNLQAAGSGFVGGTVMMAARFGIARGLFSNESGMGSAPIIAAASQSRNSVRQGLISCTGTFWDTVVVCAITGLVIVSSVIAHPDIDQSQGAALTYAAFDKIPYIGRYVLASSLIAFTFSTILGWSYYGEKSIEYLFVKHRWVVAYRWAWVVMVFVGAIANLSTVWSFADIMNALMVLPNVVSLLMLNKIIVKETRHYLWNDHLNDYDRTIIPFQK